MNKGVFATKAQKYWAIGLSALPEKPGEKKPAIANWTSYQANPPSKDRRAEWLSRYSNCGIGINLGTQVADGEQIAAIDADDDIWVRPLRGVFGEEACAKRGKKGATFFVRVPKSEKVKSTVLKAVEGFGAIDILSGGKQTVLPPSIHPNTGQPYKWLGQPLHKTKFEDLPQVDKRFLGVLATAIKSEHVPCLVSGKETHSAALSFTAQLVAADATDSEIKAFVLGLFPDGYAGDTHKELPGMIASAREKGFENSAFNVPYDPGGTGPIPLGFDKNGTSSCGTKSGISSCPQHRRNS